MIDALWITLYSIPSCLALRARSVWVVALFCTKRQYQAGKFIHIRFEALHGWVLILCFFSCDVLLIILLWKLLLYYYHYVSVLREHHVFISTIAKWGTGSDKNLIGQLISQLSQSEILIVETNLKDINSHVVIINQGKYQNWFVISWGGYL